MNLYDLKGFISNLAVVTTVIQFLSGVLVCRQYVANRTTGEASPLPFICGVISSTLWLLYGITKNDNKIILVNVIGVTLMATYTVLFYMFTYKKFSTLTQIVFSIAFLLFSVAHVSMEENKEVLLVHLGLAACILTLLTIAAPMSKLIYVLRVRCTECLPFPMILMSFFVSSLWYLYGVIEDDEYLIIPNAVGSGLALLQLSLFIVFPRKQRTPLLAKSIQA